MSLALTLQPEFVRHASEIRAGRPVDDVARRYIRRDQGRRREVVEVYLEAAAAADPYPDNRYVKMAVWNVGNRAWCVDGGLEPGQPRRQLRRDVSETIAIAAYRVARRGAGRCAEPECAGWMGAKLRSDNIDDRADHCAEHAFRDRKPRAFVEIDRMLFDAVVPIVLGGESKPRRRRAQRAA